MTDTLHLVCPHCDKTNRLPAVRLAERPNCGACRQALFDGHPLAVDSARFTRHVQANDIPVVVDFWAPWCGPCRAMAPQFEKAASLLEPGYRLAKLNTGEEQGIAARFNIRSIPTIAIFRGGHEVARQSGAMDAQSLARWVKQSLGAAASRARRDAPRQASLAQRT